jgi:K+-sensing histidine kinase KdpD
MAVMTSTQQILVVANETATGDDLHRTVRAFAADPAARVHVVAPARNDASAPAAEQRLRMCIAQLEDLGLDVRGHVGDPDPMRAIADALVSFPATELVIATHPEARSNWLADDLVDRALARFGLPTVHMAVDAIAPRLLVTV